MYVPPFHITNRMLTEAAQISELLGKLDSYQTFESKPYLRRSNRIRSIHASLAIEASSLSPEEVRDVIGGKLVMGPMREIQEVKNAYRAYDTIGHFDVYSVDELKRMHGVMTELTLQESGSFRRGHEGVFNGEQCIFIAPPPELVPAQMEALFAWMRSAADELHPLILSCVFHYEFVFIHPFTDGNGRMARLWQTALLAQWKGAFQYLPIESHIHEFQAQYYEAIAACHRAGCSDVFVEFMLDQIRLTVQEALVQLAGGAGYPSKYLERLLSVMEYGVPYSASQLLSALSLKSKENLRKHYIAPALERGLIEMSIPDKPRSKNQTYVRR